ncbi:MAG: hypothetical protein LBI45_08860, partial [Bacteroidales bacterium]|nr:hypothetical protein [Bacteroidales bacterium]
MIQVYRRTNGVEASGITISDKNASRLSEIMGVDEVRVSIVVDAVLDIHDSDYIKINGIRYTLNRDAEYTKKSEVEYSYDLIFEHPLYTLFDKLFVNKITGSAIDTITGKARDFIEQIVCCVNKTAGNPLGVDTGWTVGAVEDTGFKTITFDSISCRDMLSLVCETFNIEFFLTDKQINAVSRIENETNLVFEQGRGKGLYTVSQLNVDRDDTVTRVYPVGGNQNVPNANADYAGNLKLPEIYLENFQDFEKVVERKIIFDDIFPEFIGIVNTVSGENNKEIVSNKIDFDLNQIAVGDNARINFLTGDLMGVSFTFQYNHAQKKVTLIEQEDEIALPNEEGVKPQVPNANKKPKVGDEFNFTGVIMPKSYVDNAIGRLRDKATEWLDFHSRKRVKFELNIDHRFMRGKQKLKIGDLVTLKIPEKNIQKLIRVTRVEENLRTGAISATVSNYLDEKWEKKIEGQISQLQTSIMSGGGSNGAIDIIERFDQRPLTDKNVLSSLRSRIEFISKKTNDTAEGLITFLKG